MAKNPNTPKPSKATPAPKPETQEPAVQDEATAPATETEEVAQEAEEGEVLVPEFDAIVAAANEMTETMGLEPALYSEGMDEATLTDRVKSASSLIAATDPLTVETKATLTALGWVDPAAKKIVARTKKAPTKKAAKESTPKVAKDWANSTNTTDVIIRLTVGDASRTKAQVAEMFKQLTGQDIAKGTLNTQYAVAKNAMECAKALGLLKD